jgi:hypothetical protein
MTRLVLTLAFLALFPWSVGAQVTPIDPTPPATFTPSFAAPLRTVGPLTTIAAVQTALTTALCGDLILADHTVTFTQTVGWTLPTGLACTGNNYVTLTTDAHALLPPTGTRVGTGDLPNMVHVVVGQHTNGFIDMPLGNVKWIRIRGFYVTTTTTVPGSGLCPQSSACSLLNIHDDGSFAGGMRNEHYVIDQNYMIGDPVVGVQHGIIVNGNDFAVRDNVILNSFLVGSETHGTLTTAGSRFAYLNNEVCAASINLFFGDSQVSYWTGGAYMSGSPIQVEDATVRRNYVHKYCIPGTKEADEKNLFEIKNGRRFFIDSNIFEWSKAKAQQMCVQLVSYRGSQSSISDIAFTNNWVKHCPAALGVTFHPVDATFTVTNLLSDGSAACSGGPCIQINISSACSCTTGDLAEVKNVTGITDANGTWLPITLLNPTTGRSQIRLPVAWPGGTWTGGGSISIQLQGNPNQRVKIYNNLFTNPGADTVNVGLTFPVFQFGVNPLFVPASGTHASISTTGDWKPNDFHFAHNTVINPTGTFKISRFWSMAEGGLNFATYTEWLGDRWAIRDNVFHVSSGGQSNYGVLFFQASGAGVAVGTNAFNRTSVAATRDFSHNIGFQSSFANESAQYTGSDSWILVTTTGCSAVIFVDCTTDAVAAAALQVSSPGHLTASDGTDVGINAPLLASKVSGVVAGTPEGAAPYVIKFGGDVNVGSGTLKLVR